MIAVLLALSLGAADGENVWRDLQRLDRELYQRQQALDALETREATLRTDLALLAARGAQARVRENEALARLAGRVRALWRLPRGSRLALLGASRSLSELLSAGRLLRAVGRHDRLLHDAFAEEHDRWAAAEAAAEAKRAEIDAAVAALQQERNRLVERRGERLAVLAAAVADRKAAALLDAARSAADRELLATLRRLQPTGRLRGRFGANRGRLPWPVPGELGLRFGEQLDPLTRTRITHHGVDIVAPLGTAVQAVAPGEVAFADWLDGYGQTVILDHADGYHTVYAHCGALAVAVGTPVEVGTRLGAVGDTGSLSGAALHFEVRAQGVPEDPVPWLRR